MTRIILLCLLCLTACGKTPSPDPTPETEPYFPPNTGTWESTAPEALSWNTSEIENLKTLLENNGTRAFILLVKGRIVIEEYFGKNLLNLLPFTKNTRWYWASAGKTLTAFAVGKAAEEGFLSLNDKSNQYLHTGWTSLSPEQEDQITILHQLTMTSGLNDTIDNFDTSPENLQYLAAPGSRWAYHNATYTLLHDVISNATNQDFETYLKSKLMDKIGMDGDWNWVGKNHIYFSTARSMARFGLLIQNNGIWKDERLINETFLTKQKTPSQTINESYGYLWWLNGQSSYMLPASQTIFPGSLIPSAPADMYCGLGANGQYLCIIPSKDMVIVRMGENPDDSLAPISFLDDIWKLLNKIL